MRGGLTKWGAYHVQDYDPLITHLVPKHKFKNTILGTCSMCFGVLHFTKLGNLYEDNWFG